jgi:N-acyl-D-amino-acid deacylase
MRTLMQSLLLLSSVICILGAASASERKAKSATAQAIDRAIPVMEKSLVEYPKHNTCFSCHHHGVPSFALELAAQRGHAVNSATLPGIQKHTNSDLKTDIELYRKGQGQPGGVTRAGYALFALQSTEQPRSEITDAVVAYLLKKDSDLGRWRGASNRPPSEKSDFTNTFLSIRALNTFTEASEKDAAAARIDQARKWLESAEPKETEDRVFQLWGMKEAGSPVALLHKAAQTLLAEQQTDGGWAQLPATASDAYATGSVLTALLTTGELSASDPACKRAVRYLVHAQQPDGSWYVASRSKPVQPYFESGFPHGRDQFISALATGWSIAALALTEPVTH